MWFSSVAVQSMHAQGSHSETGLRCHPCHNEVLTWAIHGQDREAKLFSTGHQIQQNVQLCLRFLCLENIIFVNVTALLINKSSLLNNWCPICYIQLLPVEKSHSQYAW